MLYARKTIKNTNKTHSFRSFLVYFFSVLVCILTIRQHKNTSYMYITLKILPNVQSNLVITNMIGPAKSVCYNRGSV
jgi:hypothetical protein